jgi:serine/threonine protein kinase
VPRRHDPSVPSVQIDGFDELQPIGRGGFSYVFSARQRDFNRRVALKVLSFGLADERERRSFERECRAMGLVSQHPHIVTVFNAAFTTAKQPCIVMELYSGGTYGERQKREGQLPVGVVLDVGVKIAGALQTAHDRGLLHRDIKPTNLFISEFGEPALGDFGISTLDDERSISGGGGLTVHYAPPEVLEGSPATPISDVYSLAATLYTLLEGTRPFGPKPGARQSVGDLARRIMLEDPPRVKRPDVSRALAEVLAAGMSKRPGARQQSAAALGQDLQSVQGELGLSVTPLPLATPLPLRSRQAPATRQGEISGDSGGVDAGGVDLGAAAPVAGPSIPPPPTPAPVDVAPPASMPMRPVGAGDDDGEHANTVTVGRAPVVPTDTTTTAGREEQTSTRRVVIGTAAGVVCLLAVAISLLVFGHGGGDSAATTVPPSVTQILDLRPPPPQRVTITQGTDPRQLVVSWSPVGDGSQDMRYQVKPQTTGLQAQNTTALSVTFRLPDELKTRPCFQVVAITPDGRLSNPSELACL